MSGDISIALCSQKSFPSPLVQMRVNFAADGGIVLRCNSMEHKYCTLGRKSRVPIRLAHVNCASQSVSQKCCKREGAGPAQAVAPACGGWILPLCHPPLCGECWPSWPAWGLERVWAGWHLKAQGMWRERGAMSREALSDRAQIQHFCQILSLGQPCAGQPLQFATVISLGQNQESRIGAAEAYPNVIGKYPLTVR